MFRVNVTIRILLARTVIVTVMVSKVVMVSSDADDSHEGC